MTQPRQPGYGSTGDVSIQRDKFDQVKTVWRLAVRYAGGRTISYFCLLGVAALLLSLWRGWPWVWWAFQWAIEILASILLVIWGHAFRKASRDYYKVAIENPSYPLPYGQVDPHLAGITNARDFPTIEDHLADGEVVHTFKGTVVVPGGQRMATLRTHEPEKWYRYARALTRTVLPAQFTGNTAEKVYKIKRSEWEILANQMIVNRMAYKTSLAVNAHTYLYASGKEWFKGLLQGSVDVAPPENEENE